MNSELSAVIAPLIKRGIFETEEKAVRELLRSYMLGQIDSLQRTVSRFEQHYGMTLERFSEYLHERSSLLMSEDLSAEQRTALGRSVMQEEDDWLDWRASREMLDSWLGLREEVAA